MNRRGFLTVLGLAPVVGVMAARDAVAAAGPKARALDAWRTGLISRNEALAGEAFIGESVGETTQQLLERAHRAFRDWEQSGVDDPTRAEILAFAKRDEPGVAI